MAEYHDLFFRQGLLIVSSPDRHSNPVKLNDALLSSLCQQYVYVNHTHGISVFMGSFQGRWCNGKNKYVCLYHSLESRLPFFSQEDMQIMLMLYLKYILNTFLTVSI